MKLFQTRYGPLTGAQWTGVFVFVAALLLRTALVGSARLTGDEARDWKIGVDIAHFKSFPVLGAMITDGRALLPGPTFYYLVALPSLVTRAPEAQFLFIEVLGAVGALMFWHAMRRPFGEFGAALAGCLVGLSPWAALYADRTWNPNVLPTIGFAAVLAAVRLREDPRSPWLAAFLPLCAVMAQFHMSAPVFWVGVFPLVATTIPKWNRKWLLIGLAITVAFYLPLIGHELATGFANTKHLFAETLGAKKEQHASTWNWVPVYLMRIMTLDVTYHENMGYWGGPVEWRNVACLWNGTAARPFHWLRFFALACSVVLMLWSFGAALARRRVSAWGVAFVAVLAANTLLIFASGKLVFGHYVILMLPLGFVAYAHLGAWAADKPRARIAVVALAVVFCLGGIEATIATSYRTDGRNGIAVHRGFFAAVREDKAADQALKNEPVKLDFGFPGGSLYHYEVFQQTALDDRVRFDGRAAKLKYRLTDPGAKVPPDQVVGEVRDLGYAWLYRLK